MRVAGGFIFLTFFLWGLSNNMFLACSWRLNLLWLGTTLWMTILACAASLAGSSLASTWVPATVLTFESDVFLVVLSVVCRRALERRSADNDLDEAVFLCGPAMVLCTKRHGWIAILVNAGMYALRVCCVLRCALYAAFHGDASALQGVISVLCVILLVPGADLFVDLKRDIDANIRAGKDNIEYACTWGDRWRWGNRMFWASHKSKYSKWM